MSVFNEELLPKLVRLKSFNALHDFADKLHMFTVMLYFILMVVMFSQYALTPIQCYIPVSPSGARFSDFLNAFCWTHGTIPIRPDEPLPSTMEQWMEYDKVRRIVYYQWIPFLLGAHFIMCLLPQFIWRSLCETTFAEDILELQFTSMSTAYQGRAIRRIQAVSLGQAMEELNFTVEPPTERCGCNSGKCIWATVGERGRRAKWSCTIFASYLSTKVIAICLNMLQIVLAQRMLGFHSHGTTSQQSQQLAQQPSSSNPDGSSLSTGVENYRGFFFGLTLLSHLAKGKEWPETLLFPRTSHCLVTDVDLVGSQNAYTAECTLWNNLLNEKIYLFIWLWSWILLLADTISLIKWARHVGSARMRNKAIRFYLVVSRIKIDRQSTDPIFRTLMDDILRVDGVFLLQMTSEIAGEVITAETVKVMYQTLQLREKQK